MKSYLKFLQRHRLFTLINIVGLCLSMAFVLVGSNGWQYFRTCNNYGVHAVAAFSCHSARR